MTEEDEIKARSRITMPELVAWYRERALPLDVPLYPYRPEIEGRVADALDR